MGQLKDLLGGVKSREKLDSEFWSPVKLAETVVGRISEFDTRNFSGKDRDNFTLSPVIHYPQGDSGAGEGFTELRVSHNSWLKKLIRKADLGRCVAIIYTGKKDTPAGKMFVYEVRDVGETSFKQLLEQVAPGIGMSRLPEVAPATEPETLDDLPF